MIKKKFIHIVILALILATACTDPWDKHLKEYDNSRANLNLMELMEEQAELSTFVQLVKQAGYDTLLSESQMTTIWAPDNQALEQKQALWENNPEQLKRFVANHLTRGFYPQGDQQKPMLCKMLNGKNVSIDMAQLLIYHQSIEGTFNQVASNGILHHINQAIEPRPSIWEYVEANATINQQIVFLNSLTGERFNDSIAQQIGFDPVTSEPVYDTLSGMEWYNQFVIEHADLRHEDSLFTLFVLDDAVFAEQFNRFAPYYQLKETDDTDSVMFTRYMISVDLVARDLITQEWLDGKVTTLNGIELPLYQGDVYQTIPASNGLIHFVSNCNLTLKQKFPPIYIEGEDANKVIYKGGGKTGYTRQKPLARGGYDFVLDDHDGAPARIIYHAGMMARTRYNFYWKAVDDFNGTYYGAAPDSLIRQKLEKVIYLPNAPLENRFPMHRSISDSLLFVSDLSYQTAEERYAGSFVFTYYEDLWLQLVGSGVNTTLTLDYLKIEPVFEE